MSVGIIGLGLMGGSLGLDLRALGNFGRVVGCDANGQNAAEALKLGLVDELGDMDEVKQCDIVLLAVPVEISVQLLGSWGETRDETTIIDLGSTKEGVVRAVPKAIRKNFVAAHPMTGTEYSGAAAAKRGLYTDKTVVLCDIEESSQHQVQTAKKLFESVGARLVTMGAAEHDRHASFISHLPHLISFSLANTVLAQEDKESILALAAGGFRDMSRLAKSSPVMWEQIFHQNKGNLLASLAKFKEELQDFENALKNDEWDSVSAMMRRANELSKIFS